RPRLVRRSPSCVRVRPLLSLRRAFRVRQSEPPGRLVGTSCWYLRVGQPSNGDCVAGVNPAPGCDGVSGSEVDDPGIQAAPNGLGAPVRFGFEQTRERLAQVRQLGPRWQREIRAASYE